MLYTRWRYLGTPNALLYRKLKISWAWHPDILGSRDVKRLPSIVKNEVKYKCMSTLKTALQASTKEKKVDKDGE